jgi:hypothetical protein
MSSSKAPPSRAHDQASRKLHPGRGIAAAVLPTAVLADGSLGAPSDDQSIEIEAAPLGNAEPGPGAVARPRQRRIGDLLAVARGLSSTWADWRHRARARATDSSTASIAGWRSPMAAARATGDRLDRAADRHRRPVIRRPARLATARAVVACCSATTPTPPCPIDA